MMIERIVQNLFFQLEKRLNNKTIEIFVIFFLVWFEIFDWEGNYVIGGKDVRIRRIGNTGNISLVKIYH